MLELPEAESRCAGVAARAKMSERCAAGMVWVWRYCLDWWVLVGRHGWYMLRAYHSRGRDGLVFRRDLVSPQEKEWRKWDDVQEAVGLKFGKAGTR